MMPDLLEGGSGELLADREFLQAMTRNSNASKGDWNKINRFLNDLSNQIKNEALFCYINRLEYRSLKLKNRKM